MSYLVIDLTKLIKNNNRSAKKQILLHYALKLIITRCNPVHFMYGTVVLYDKLFHPCQPGLFNDQCLISSTISNKCKEPFRIIIHVLHMNKLKMVGILFKPVNGFTITLMDPEQFDFSSDNEGFKCMEAK